MLYHAGFFLYESYYDARIHEHQLFAPIKNQVVKRKMKAEKQKEVFVMWHICLFERNASTKTGNISQYQLSK